MLLFIDKPNLAINILRVDSQMSLSACTISLIGYIILYISRQGYSYGMPLLREQYHIHHFTTATMSALMFMGVGLGFTFRYFFLGEGQHPIKKMCLNGLAMCFFCLCIPLIPWFRD